MTTETKTEMQLRCDRKVLVKALDAIGKFATKRSAMPVTECVKIEAGEGLRLTGTNLDHWCVMDIPPLEGKRGIVDVEVPGSSVVSCSMLRDVLSSFDGEIVSLSMEGLTLTVVCDRQRAGFSTYDVDDYPPMPRVDAVTCQLAAEKLRAGLGRAVIAAAKQDTRPVLHGVAFQFSEDGLRLVGADGFRLAVVKVDAEVSEGSYVVPRAAAVLIERLLSSDGTVQVGFSDSHILVRQGRMQMISRLVEGAYPNWWQLFSSEEQMKVVFKRKEALAALRSVQAVKREGATVLNFTEDRLVISGKSMELGDVVGEVDARVEGGALRIGIDGGYLSEGLKAINADMVECRLTGATAPAVFTAEGCDEFTYLVMPMALSS